MKPTIDQYLATLAPATQQRSTALLAEIEEVLTQWRNPSADLTEPSRDVSIRLVFSLSGWHPEYEDAAQVFFQAFEQLARGQLRTPQEIPLVFIGYDSLTWATGKHQMQGFFLTDQTFYVQDQSSVFFDQKPARHDPLPANPEAVAAFLQKHFSSFEWVEGMINLEQRQSLQRLLSLLMLTVIEHHRVQGTYVAAPKPAVPHAAASFDELLLATALTERVQDGRQSSSAKALDKVASKFQIPAGDKILFAMTDKPMFGGPYGFAVTRHRLYTRDLMESPQSIEFSDLIAETGLRVSEDQKNLETSAGVEIFLPTHLTSTEVVQVVSLIQTAVGLIQSGVMTG